ncbi:MAG TPA: MerR family DNA-binding transcriptional regulator [Pseudonocardiaceae bacterium]|nr:MerR family DNA-binding transcriptional regulator [Pseudonocardiaceae bacterium]
MGRADTGLRPVDLARLAGISTQQIRNYADAGILPPAPRTRAGYRRFDARHRRALLTYRALTRGYGSDTARAIMQAVHARISRRRSPSSTPATLRCTSNGFPWQRPGRRSKRSPSRLRTPPRCRVPGCASVR